MKSKIIKYKGKKIEVEIEDEQKGKIFSEIEIPKGWKLWTYQMCVDFHNDKELRKKLHLEDCWFFIEQPIELNKEKGYIAKFWAVSGVVELYCSGDPQFSGAGLGIRFFREVK